MLQVTNGVVTLTVTKGAFKSFYEHNGFPVSYTHLTLPTIRLV